MGGILEGVRVLDFGRYIAGPYCATLLAEFGAEVIRVEKRDGSEDRFVAPVGAGGEGALFLQINRNKKCITLDPMKAEGQEVLRRLVERSDVVIANLPPQTLRAMKLDYESLKAIKPDIILTTATAFGNPGPWSERVGFDGVAQVMSGAVYMTGRGDPPYRAAVPWVDFGTALHCAFGTLMALIERGKSGRGQIVEGALLATALTFANATLIEQAVIAVNRVPSGNLGQTAAPADIYRSKDGWVLCQVTGQPLFVRWAKLMGEGHWLTDPRFADDIKRGDNGAVISERMARWCAERTTQDAVDTLAACVHSGSACAESAAGAGSSAHSRHRFPEERGLSGSAEPRAGRARRGSAFRDSRRNRKPPADARRAHRSRAGRAWLRCGSHRRTAQGGIDLAASARNQRRGELHGNDDDNDCPARRRR